MRLASEMTAIDNELRELGIIRSKGDKKRKARTVYKKIFDSEIKEKLTFCTWTRCCAIAIISLQRSLDR